MSSSALVGLLSFFMSVWFNRFLHTCINSYELKKLLICHSSLGGIFPILI